MCRPWSDPTGQLQYVTKVHSYTGTKNMRDLTVATIHTYYVLAGETPVLVHNTGGDLSPQEQAILRESQGIYNAPEFNQIREAQAAGRSTSVVIRGVAIDYIPSLPGSGFSNRPYGFVMGPEAFASEAEVQKTILHEMYRVRGFDRPTRLLGRGGVAGDSSGVRLRRACAWEHVLNARMGVCC